MPKCPFFSEKKFKRLAIAVSEYFDIYESQRIFWIRKALPGIGLIFEEISEVDRFTGTFNANVPRILVKFA